MLIKSPQVVKDKLDIETDALLTLIKNKTAVEIEAYFDANLSALVGYSDVQIDTYVDAMTTIADVKTAIKILAKDSAFNSNMLKKVTKLVVLLTKKVL